MRNYWQRIPGYHPCLVVRYFFVTGPSEEYAIVTAELPIGQGQKWSHFIQGAEVKDPTLPDETTYILGRVAKLGFKLLDSYTYTFNQFHEEVFVMVKSADVAKPPAKPLPMVKQSSSAAEEYEQSQREKQKAAEIRRQEEAKAAAVQQQKEKSDAEAALEELRQLAFKDDVNAVFKWHESNPTTSLQLLQDAAAYSEENTECMTLLAEVYLGEPRDASKQQPAMNNFLRYHAKSAFDPVMSLRCFQNASSKGHKRGQYGEAYLLACPAFKEQLHEAGGIDAIVKLLESSAKQGFARAYYALGVIYSGHFKLVLHGYTDIAYIIRDRPDPEMYFPDCPCPEMTDLDKARGYFEASMETAASGKDPYACTAEHSANCKNKLNKLVAAAKQPKAARPPPGAGRGAGRGAGLIGGLLGKKRL